MIKKIVDSFVEFMIQNGAEAENRAVYAYGLECTLNELVSDLILMGIALFMGRAWEMLLWIVVFNLLRLNIGGYHASTPLRCIVLSTLMGVLCTLIYPMVMGRFVLAIFLIGICLLAVFQLAPITNQRHPLSKRRRKRAKKLARYLSCAVSALTVLLLFFSMEKLAAMLVVTFCSVCMLELVAYVSHKSQKASEIEA